MIIYITNIFVFKNKIEERMNCSKKIFFFFNYNNNNIIYLYFEKISIYS